MTPIFGSAEQLCAKLEAVGYAVDAATVNAVLRADRTGRALLVEGRPGAGKSALAVALAQASGARLIRLPCHTGIDESRALYAWDHAKQVLRLHTSGSTTSVFAEEFLLERPLLAALRGEGPTVLLIDDVDRAEIEFDALLLQVLGEFAVTVPELGTITARRTPLVVVTTTGRRELSEALRRRCHYLHLPPPGPQRERRILGHRLPGVDRRLAQALVRMVAHSGDRDLPAATLAWFDTVVSVSVPPQEEALPLMGTVAARRLTTYLRARGHAPAAQPTGLVGHVVSFVDALRGRGMVCGASDLVDAVAALGCVDLASREQVRAALSATLVHHSAELPTFGPLFDLWFPAAPAPSEGVAADPAELLADTTAETLRQLAADLVGHHGGYRSANGDSFSALQTEQAIDLEDVQGNLARALAQGAPDTPLNAAVAEQEARARVQALRGEIRRETARRVAELRGRDRVAQYVVPRVAGAIDTAEDSPESAAIGRAVVELGRVLATREASQRRRARAGEIDLRRTLRTSMSTGGVPITLVRRRKRPSKPQLVVVCDMSSSVSGFAYFTLQLVQALHRAFSKVRVFVFVDTVDEVTALFAPGVSTAAAFAAIRSHAAVSFQARTDYGRSFADFDAAFPGAVTSKTSLLVLGDARGNYSDPQVGVLGRIVAAARHAHWLNPEEQRLWGVGDSAALQYQAIMAMHECQSVEQLAAVIAQEIGG